MLCRMLVCCEILATPLSVRYQAPAVPNTGLGPVVLRPTLTSGLPFSALNDCALKNDYCFLKYTSQR